MERTPLSRQEWSVLASCIKDASFLIRQGYSPTTLGASNFVHDHSPRAVRDVWKVFNFDYDVLVDIYAKHGEYDATLAVQATLRERPQHGVCLLILEACVEDVDNKVEDRYTPQGLADKYITKTTKRRYLAKG